MSAKKRNVITVRGKSLSKPDVYRGVLGDLVDLIESARRAAARSVNSLMTATYFLVGRAIVELEQSKTRSPSREDAPTTRSSKVSGFWVG